MSLFARFCLFFIHLFLQFFCFHFSSMCANSFVQLEDSSWAAHCGLFFLPVSLSFSLSLEGLNATGASEAQERSLGKKEQRAVHLQLSPLCTSSPLSLSFSPCSSLPRLPSLPSPHWPAPQIKTSDKKMGSIKKGEKATEREKEGSP